MGKWRIFFTLVLIFGPSTAFGCFGKTAEMGIALTAGALAAAFVNFDKFEKFKGAGIEFEIKKAEKIISEANATLEQLRAVTEPLIVSNIKIISEGLTWDGFPEKEEEKFLSIIQTLNSTTLKSSEVEKAMERHHFIRRRQLYNEIIYNVQKQNEQVANQLYQFLDEESLYCPPESKIVEVLKGLDKVFQETNELLADYSYYYENKVHRPK